MIELFPNISDDARQQAELAWTLACKCDSPAAAANMLDSFTNFYCSLSDEPEIREFLNFYFTFKLEEAKNADTSSIG